MSSKTEAGERPLPRPNLIVAHGGTMRTGPSGSVVAHAGRLNRPACCGRAVTRRPTAAMVRAAIEAESRALGRGRVDAEPTGGESTARDVEG